MSLVKKLKDILFEVEDDDTEPIKINDDVKKEEKHYVANEPVEIKKNLSVSTAIEDEEDKEVAKEESVQSERVLFTQEKAFQFPSFDEEEFQNSISRTKQNSNVLDLERKKNSEKKNEYRSYDRDVRTEEKKKFKPSPIISPVYGILNQDYVADDIVKKDNSQIDIESVRKKAFEPEKDKTETLEIKTPNINDIVNDTMQDMPNHIDEPVVTFFEDKDKTQEEDNSYQSVSDLLESASETLDLDDTLEIPKSNNLDAIEEELEKMDEEDNKDLDDALNEALDKEDTLNVSPEGALDDALEDTLDNDLFELIDSMYDERKED